jgi:glycosyltransferase involved in cell wall biosynthesis
MALFTVFTPTYNRASTLHRVYDSLRAQTLRDFEWLIVDDGSSDNTSELVKGWQKQADFPIAYHYQTNRGKHIAFNRGVTLAQGELFLTLDSDDACVPTALERLVWHWRQIPDNIRARYSAVTALCVDPNGRPVGDRFPRDTIDSNTLEMRYRYKIRGEKWGFQRTDILRQFPFPEIAGLTHCPETVVWSVIGRRYLTRYVNEALRIYYPADSPEAQLSSIAPARLARAALLEHTAALNQELDWFRMDPGRFVRSAVHYVRFSLHAGIGPREQWRALHPAGARMLWLMAAIPGMLIYLRERNA